MIRWKVNWNSVAEFDSTRFSAIPITITRETLCWIFNTLWTRKNIRRGLVIGSKSHVVSTIVLPLRTESATVYVVLSLIWLTNKSCLIFDSTRWQHYLQWERCNEEPFHVEHLVKSSDLASSCLCCLSIIVVNIKWNLLVKMVVTESNAESGSSRRECVQRRRAE